MIKNKPGAILNRPRRILVAPLDWGLGHTTRCMPIIGWLRHLGHIPVVVGNEWQRGFIEKTFTGIETINLEGYDVTYGSGKGNGKMAILSQLPRLVGVIKKEYEWLQLKATELKLEGIISDNRYGLHFPGIPSVIITHQLQVQTGFGGLANRTLQKLHYKYLEKFNEVWIPDIDGWPNLGGALSHPGHLPRSASYLGLLSQFEDMAAPPVPSTPGYILVLLSGPEPQRSILSGLLWTEVLKYPGKVIFVGGNQSAATPSHIPGNITFYNRVEGSRLAGMINGAELVICRSGYSTIMDLMLLGKKALLIPTPGQTEQEYLAENLSRQGIFPYALQAGFDLGANLEKIKKFPFNLPAFSGHYSDYRIVLEDWLNH